LTNPFSILIICGLPQRTQSLHSLVSSLDHSSSISISDYSQPWKVIRKRLPDILILDRCFSNFDVKDLLVKVKAAFPRMRCIVLDDAFLEESFLTHRLADAILKSDSPTSYLLEAVHQQILILKENM
jgi:hypothetical protein